MSGSGYQWFALSRIDPHETARGTEAAAPALEAFLDAELARHKLGPENLALVGFSQGTMMSLHVGLRRKVPPAAIVGFSGMLAAPERLPKSQAASPPILLTHGDEDQVIPAAALFFSAGALGAAGFSVRWHLAQGLGHGIDQMGLMLGGRFLYDAFRGKLKQAGPLACRYPRTSP
jgi:phospholipase/carboxylesterase